jgi:saxitoxin biosynthesis operon SxtJ-like protein
VQKTASSRSFGFLLAAALLIVAALSYWAHGHAYVYWGTAGIVLLLFALAMPRILAPLKRLWLKLGRFLHVVVSPLILAAVYLLVFIPVGAIIRLFGKDLLSSKLDPSATSYWIARTGSPTPESLKDQF